MRDTLNDTTVRLNEYSGGTDMPGAGDHPMISGDGTVAVFSSVDASFDGTDWWWFMNVFEVEI